MSLQMAGFLNELKLTAAIHRGNPNRATELNALATALGSDTATHDVRLQAPPAGLVPGSALNSRFTNDCLLIVNIGKASGLTPAAMGTAISSGLAQIFPPANTAAPVASGTGTVGQALSVTNGTWSYTPTSYTYQWQRAGADISGATASTYTLVAADSGKSVRCIVSATNAAGTASAASNAIAVA